MTDLPKIPDELFDAAVKAYCDALPGFPSDTVHDDLTADAAGFRAALAVAFAAGQESYFRGQPYQWGTRLDGRRSVQVCSEDLAHYRHRTGRGGRELLRRRLGPWELVEYVPPRPRGEA